MKVITKILIILLIVGVFTCITTPLKKVEALTIGNAMNGAQSFLQKGNQQANSSKIINPVGVYNVLNFLYGLLLFAAISFAAIRGTLIGLKIVLGSVEERADAKSMLVPYLWIVAGIAFGGIILREILEIIMKVVD